MSLDSDSQGELFQYFLNEAPELLEVIEETLLSLIEEKTIDKVHTLMRSAHTLKGSAASVEQATIQTIAHHLEDVFQALYPEELEIDRELGTLLLEGYECLRTPLSATLADIPYDENEILERTATVFAQLQHKLGDFFGREAPIPTSEELGFDVVGSIFNDSIVNDLENLATVIASGEIEEIEELLRSQADFFMDLGISYNLPGLTEIAETVVAAIEENTDEIIAIAEAALDNFQQARTAILAGDRERGGEVSEQLHNWVDPDTSFSAFDEDSFFLEPVEDDSDLTGIFAVNLPDADPVNLEEEAPLELAETFAAVEIEPETAAGDAKPISVEAACELESESQTAPPSSALEKILQSIAVDTAPVIGSESAAPQDTAPTARSEKATAALPTIRVAIEQLDRLNHTVGELFIEENQQNLRHERLQILVRETLQEFRSCQRQVSHLSSWSGRQTREHRRQQRRRYQRKSSGDRATSIVTPPVTSIQSGFDLLEMDTYSDLDIMLQSLSENLVQLGDKIDAVDRILQQSYLKVSKRQQLLGRAQEELLAARMLPLSTVLNRFPRHIQQLEATYNKPVRLKIVGSEVTIDKAIAEKLYEPLLHLIRNAYDHGIEAAEIRLQQNKPETGTIAIQAYNRGNRTIIQVGDDGNGINWERVLTKAMENRLLNPTEVANISQAQLADVLFQPGFSTAATVSNLSGRGVGLDVVKSQIEALNGSISLRSEHGEGTTFTLQLPLNLTTARLLLCQAKGVTYALLSTEIKRVVAPSTEEIQQQPDLLGLGSGTFWRCQQEENIELIPICAIEDLVNYRYPVVSRSNALVEMAPPKRQQSNLLLLIQTEERKLCLKVEQILGERELVIKSLNSLAILPSYIQGYSVLDDSNLSLVINPMELVSDVTQAAKAVETSDLSSHYLAASNTELDAATDSANATKNIQILIVEDSIVQRQSLVMSLEKAGYQAVQAANGREAIALLNENPDISLIICDIEMPVMNGFEFLSYCQHSAFSQLPVIMVTTRSGQKHRDLALSLGAKAYITKPANNRQLIEVISEYLKS